MRKENRAIILVFLITLAVRLIFAFQNPYFSHDAYFHLRQVEYITAHGTPFFYDELSYDGRNLIFPPLFHYTLALFDLFLPLNIVAKVLPNIFASSLVFAVYLIAKKITKNHIASFFSAFVSGFIPIFVSKTINSVSPYSLLIPLIFFALYLFLSIEDDKKYVTYFIVVIFLLPLVHQLAFIFLVALLFYLILAMAERISHTKAETEIILFSVFMTLWIYFLIYKQAFLVHGSAIIWQNIPRAILSNYFSEFNILKAIYEIGVVPFIFGIFVIYQYIFRKKTRETYLLFGFALATGFLLWLKLVELVPGLIILGIILSILFSQFYLAFVNFLEKTKAALYKKHIIILFLFLFIMTSVAPSIMYAKQETKDSLTEKEYLAMLWLKDHTKNNSIILCSLEDSFAVQAIAQRRTLMDKNFLLVENVDQRYFDLTTMFTTKYETDSIRLLNKYGVVTIYFSDNAMEEFNVKELGYTKNPKCFYPLYEEVQIWESLCELTVE